MNWLLDIAPDRNIGPLSYGTSAAFGAR